MAASALTREFGADGKTKALSEEDERKILYWGLGAMALAGVVAFAFRGAGKKTKTKKSWGIKVSPQCNSFEVTNAQKVRDQVDREIDAAMKKGPIDPFEIARAFLKRAAPKCQGYPAPARNPGEAKLFMTITVAVLSQMKERALLSDEQLVTFLEMLKVWVLDNGVAPEDFDDDFG